MQLAIDRPTFAEVNDVVEKSFGYTSQRYHPLVQT